MKIIIIDDEEKLRKIVRDYLENEGYEVVEGIDGLDGFEKIIEHNDFDLILLDVRMPNMDGYETLIEIKKVTDTPVIFFTALDEVYDEVKGLNLGADDYITKPFSYDILIARVKSCLRRTQKQKPLEYTFKELRISFTNKKVYINDDAINLTQKEFELLEYLIVNKNMTLERTRILDRIWGFDYYGDPRTVDTHIKTMRFKLGCYSDNIKTIRGVGYKFEVDED